MGTQEKQSGFGIASLVLGIVGILLSCIAIGIVPAIIGLIMSIIGLTRKDRKHGTAIAGLICSIVAIVIFLLFALVIGSSNDSGNQNKKIGTIESQTENTKEETKEKEESKDDVFTVGDIVETPKLKITFISAGEYKSDNEFIQPKEGNVYYRMEFEFENISDSDQAISSLMDWSCYADDYSVDQAWIGDDQIDTTLSPGKKVKGAVYYEVPADSESIVLEYKVDYWTEDKVVFSVK